MELPGPGQGLFLDRGLHDDDASSPRTRPPAVAFWLGFYCGPRPHPALLHHAQSFAAVSPSPYAGRMDRPRCTARHREIPALLGAGPSAPAECTVDAGGIARRSARKERSIPDPSREMFVIYRKK